MKTRAVSSENAALSRKRMLRSLKKNLVSYSFLLPFIIGTLVFTLYPIAMSFLYALSNFNGTRITQIGFFNFEDIFDFSEFGWGRRVFGSLGVTFGYVFGNMAVSLVLSYVLALFLYSNIPGIRAIRVLCYLPCLIPGIAAGFIWTDAFSANLADPSMNGLFNTWLMKLGLEPLTFFTDASSSLATLIFTGLWGIGGGMIMWLAAFGNISPELYEAAKMDGAGYFRRLFFITVPMSTPILFYNVVTSMIGGLQVFGTYANYSVGVDDSLHFIAIRIYITAFQDTFPGNYGLACAMAWILFIIIAALTLVMFKTGGWIQYGEGDE
ncbi:MAG TPA: sugar ABC transporter permease [Candidatus Borkfalkia excrementigallinarum]|uniref:Sugar ABC transporter permease n=1 Tax=Candidatus Borkfalkia excrementigallinarum TaxID=2838506 RepID=A0A9D1ZTB3_9FIRM|nr:sugar ABC transporter permease [Candidatus Borkfalkia excrementigallinarum]